MNINLTNLSVILPDSGRRLFRIKNLKIASGEKVLIQGPSGRDKTTLLHVIAGLLMPDQGEVEIDRIKYRFLSETERSRFRRGNLAIIFQKLNLLNHLTACENVLLGASRPGFTKRQAQQALERVNMGEYADTLAEEGQAVVGAKMGGIDILLGALNLEGKYPQFIPYRLYQSLKAREVSHFADGTIVSPEAIRAVIPLVYFADLDNYRVIGTSEDFLNRPEPQDSPALAEVNWAGEMFEVVAGRAVAVREGLFVGQTVQVATAGIENAPVPRSPWQLKVSGILKPTGKIWDYALFSNVSTRPPDYR